MNPGPEKPPVFVTSVPRRDAFRSIPLDETVPASVTWVLPKPPRTPRLHTFGLAGKQVSDYPLLVQLPPQDAQFSVAFPHNRHRRVNASDYIARKRRARDRVRCGTLTVSNEPAQDYIAARFIWVRNSICGGAEA